MTTGRSLSIGEQARKLFDAKAATWPAKYVPDGRLADRLSRLSAAAQQYLPPGGSILDLGCGTGELARTLAIAGFRVTGCDISAEMLDRAALARDTESVSWVRLDPGWQALPFGPSTFDVVVASSVLEYVDNPRAVLRECARVLRPGAAMLCTVPDPAHPVRWLERLIQMTAREPLARAIRRHVPRLDSYLVYLDISRQRRPARWWHRLAESTGLDAVVTRSGTQAPSPLRLLVFRRSDRRNLP